MASQHFQIQPPKVKLPVPHSFLHVLSAFERLFYPRHWMSDCGNLASAAGTQVHINSVFGEISIIPRLCEGHQPKGIRPPPGRIQALGVSGNV